MQNSILPIVTVGRSLIQKFARSSGWIRRVNSGNALTPSIFVQALVASVATGQRSLRELATEIGLLSRKTFSKQGLSKWINANAVKFLKQVAAEALRHVACCAPELVGQIAGVGRILIGDSSTLPLHSSLAEHFQSIQEPDESIKSSGTSDEPVSRRGTDLGMVANDDLVERRRDLPERLLLLIPKMHLLSQCHSGLSL